MKKNPALHGIAIEDIPKGGLVKFDLINGHVSVDYKIKKFRFYEKPKGKFDLKDKDMKR